MSVSSTNDELLPILTSMLANSESDAEFEKVTLSVCHYLMTWFFHSQTASAINNLLVSEDVTVTKVIEDAEFSQAVKSANPKLQEFLQRDEIMDEFMDWVLTDKMKENPNYIRNSRQVMSAVTTMTRGMQERCFKQNTVIIARLSEFGNTEYIKVERICGYFARIVEHFTRLTSGSYLSHLPNLKSFLIEQMTSLGLRDLFITLSTEFESYFKVDIEDLKKLVEQITKPECGIFAAYAFHKVIERYAIMDLVLIESDIVVQLVETAMTLPFNSLAACMAFQAALRLVEEHPSTAEKVAALGEKFEFELRNNDCVTPFAAMLFKKPCLCLLKTLFDVPARTFLNQALVHAFGSLSDSEKAAIVEEEKLVEAVISSYDDKHKVNGHITEIAKIMSDIASDAKGPSLNSSEWNAFVDEKLTSRIHLINDIPTEPRSEEYSSDDDGEQYGVCVAQDVDVDCLFDIDSSSSSDYSDDSEDSDDSLDDTFGVIEKTTNHVVSSDDDMFGDIDDNRAPPPFKMAALVDQLKTAPPAGEMTSSIQVPIDLPPPPFNMLPKMDETTLGGDQPFPFVPPPLDDDAITLPPLPVSEVTGGLPPLLPCNDQISKLLPPPPVLGDSDDDGALPFIPGPEGVNALPPAPPLFAGSGEIANLLPPPPLESSGDDVPFLLPPPPLEND